MNSAFNIFSSSLLLLGIITAMMSLVIFRRVKGPGRSFGWIMLSIAIWSAGYGAELSFSSLEYMLFLTKIEYVGISLLPACWIVFVIQFIGKEKWLSLLNICLIFSFPIITLFLVWTNEWHHLHYLQVSLHAQENFYSLAIKPGPWYWLFTCYFYLMLAFGSYLMLRTFSRANAIYRKQNITILLGVLFPWVSNMLYMLDIRPMHIDLTPYGFIVTAAVVSFGLLKFKLLYSIPIAREKIIEAMQEGVLVLDAENKIVDFNSQLIQLLSLNEQDLIGQTLADLLPNPEKVQLLLKDRVNKSVELAINTKGFNQYFEVNSRVLIEKNKVYSGLLLLFREITGQRIAQQEACSAYQLLTGVLDSSLSGVLAFRAVRQEEQNIADFECIACNQKAISLFSAETDTLVGKSLFQIVPSVKQNGLYTSYIDVVQTGKTLETEVNFQIGQDLLWLQVVAVKLEDGFTVTFTNITGRKQAEVLLESSRANLSALIENTSDLIWSVDANYCFLTINSSFKYSYSLILGKEPKIGKPIYFLKLSHPLAILWRGYFARAFVGENFNVETAIETKYGLQTFESSLSPIRNKKGTVEGITVYSRNITRRKEAENEILLAREAAENANNFKTRFLANITHEIRTPINAIIGFGEILQKQKLTAEQKEYVDYILSAGDTLLQLIGDVLDLTKIEQGKMTIEKGSFHFKKILSSAIQPYKFRAEEKGLSFQVSFDEKIPAVLIGDAGKICQIIVNLLGNALKFTEQGNIRIDFSLGLSNLSGQSLVKIEQTSEENSIVLQGTVSDTGIGIKQEQQSRIFQSFTQADASINRKFGGSGLGLSIIKEMVYLMEGQVGVISPAIVSFPEGKGGPGSTFWFTLPLKADLDSFAEQEHIYIQADKIDYKGDVSVLMVEDNQVNQRLAHLILLETGCSVTLANNGEEALAQLNKRDFDIIFMDLQMPVMDGYTATENIRLVNKKIPIVGLSANVYKEDIELCYKVGMNDYLAKPYNTEKLVDKLRKWVRPSKPLLANETHKHFSDAITNVDDRKDAKIQNTNKAGSEEILSNGHYIDLTSLQTLTGGLVSEMKQMIEAILELEEEFAAALDGWLLYQERIKLATTAHKLKGCLYLVGLDYLRESLQQLEHQSKQAETDKEMSSLCLELKSVFSSARRELEDYLIQLN